MQNSDNVEQQIQADDYQCVLAEIEQEKSCGLEDKTVSLQERITRYKLDREKRVKNFLQHVQMKRDKYFESLTKNNNKFISRPQTRCQNNLPLH